MIVNKLAFPPLPDYLVSVNSDGSEGEDASIDTQILKGISDQFLFSICRTNLEKRAEGTEEGWKVPPL